MLAKLRQDYSLGGHFPVACGLVDANELLENNDIDFMSKAMILAMSEACHACPNPSVGCVIVKNNSVISMGATEVFGKRHAEKVAFDKLIPSFQDKIDVYVTLEPCTHYGKQPPCSEIFKKFNVRKVVIGSLDPNPSVYKKGLEAMREYCDVVEFSKLRKEIVSWHLPFFVYTKYKRPYIALKWAESSNGKLADDDGQSKWISNKISRSYTHWLRQKYDAILVGAQTVLNDFPKLNSRLGYLPGKRNPLRIIFDPKGRIFKEKDAIVLKKINESTCSSEKKTILVTNLPKKHWSHEFNLILNKKDNFNKVVYLESHSNTIESLLTYLASKDFEDYYGKPFQSLFVEGGAKTLSLFIESNNFDAIHRFIGPKSLSGDKHKLNFLDNNFLYNKVELLVSQRIEDDYLYEYVKKTHYGDFFENNL